MIMLFRAPPAPHTLLFRPTRPIEKEIPMKRFIPCLLLTLTLLGVAPAAFAQDSQEAERHIILLEPRGFNEARLWLGLWKPDAYGNFWDDNFQNFDAGPSRLNGFAVGGDIIHHIDPHNALMATVGYNVTAVREPARNVLDENDDPLEHHLKVDTWYLTAGYLLYPFGMDHPVIPYLGAGAGVYGGSVNSFRSSSTTTDCEGDDDDETCTTNTAYTDSTKSSFLTFGYYALAGLEIPVSPHVAITLDGRYTVAQAHLDGNFADNNRLDLSGRQYAAGVAIRF
jgi:opacity protein-like surface antigen